MRDVDVIDLSSGTPKKVNPQSPAALTNSVPRPTAPRAVTPERITNDFLAAERFPRSSPVIAENVSSSNARSRSAFTSPVGTSRTTRQDVNHGDRDSPDEAWTTKSCSTPTRKDIQDMMKRVKEVQARAVAVTSETRCDPTPKPKARPKVIKVPLKPGRETKEQEVNCATFPLTFQSCLNNFAETSSLLYRQECAKGDHRGDDRDFFRNFGEDDSALDENRTRTSVSSISTKSQKTAEQGLRSSRGGMRFPEAINVMDGPSLDGRGRSRSAPTRRQRSRRKKQEQGSDRTPVSPTREIVNGGEDPESMRQLRLQLFKKDDESVTVPKARLSRALGELVLQDGTIDTIQNELEKTKAQLREAHREIHRQKSSTPTMKNTSGLEGKLKKRKELNVKLRSKISDLEVEVNHLRAELSRTKTESEKRIAIFRERQDEMQAQLDIALAKEKVRSFPNIERPPETPTITELRADIVNLRSQLADTRAALRKSQDASRDIAHESQLVALRAKLIRSERELAEHRSQTAGMPELVRLKTRLQRVEKELEIERLGKISPNSPPGSPGKADSRAPTGGLSEILRLRTKLHHMEKEVAKQKATAESVGATFSSREEKLTKELRDTQQLLTEKEASSRSIIEELMVRIDTADREIAEGRKMAQLEVSASREESQKLEAQVENLKKQLAKTRVGPVSSYGQTSYKQEQLERELKKCKATEKSLRSIISSLTSRVDTAESEVKEARTSSQMSGHTSKSDNDKDGVKVKIFASGNAESRDQATVSVPSTRHDASDKMLPETNGKENPKNMDLSLAENQSVGTKAMEINNSKSGDDRKKEENIRMSMMDAQNVSLQNEVFLLRARLAESEAKHTQSRSNAEEDNE